MKLKILQIAVDEIVKMNISKDNFDMKQYGGLQNDNFSNCNLEETIEKIDKFRCNTTACFLGYFPFIDNPIFIPKKSDFYDEVFSYDLYSYRILGIDCDSIIWSFLFEGAWVNYDNTLEGALNRAKYLIKCEGKLPGTITDLLIEEDYETLQNFSNLWYLKDKTNGITN